MLMVRFGLIGLGGMANHHLFLLSKLQGVKITALCDVNPDVLNSIADKYGVSEEQRYTDYDSLIQDPEVDAVISIVPNKFHGKIIQLCIQYGKPLMTEKPFTVNFEEANMLKELFEKKPIPCMVGFSYRYIPAFRFVKQLLEEGRFGTIRHISVNYLQQWGAEIYDVPYSWRFSKEMSGSGALGDLGSHMIDSARYFIGEFKAVAGMMTTFVTERQVDGVEMKEVDVDDFTSFQATFQNGAMGTFVTSRNAIGSGNQLEIIIYGNKGTVKLCCDQPDEVEICLKSKENKEATFEKVKVPENFYLNQLQDFIDFVAGKSVKDVPGFVDGYENQRVMESIMTSAKTGQTVEVHGANERIINC
ncbi:Gfo/Idh/MocA family oxidoreductase [Sutcliffiella horikoshii]|uniref:Gfo/Idh/MocA family protein n=1 Tax=Sutcliffiella horikoshii TaxID=79883 RepID=UPI002041FE52|nr:Gfo/Idh/MocA family oxidoreductase [Sutcliffiella horikoshii]MCM3618475.1 Gfo/Idh/MocA family oxidoreductase [Sutcliffiella horikoshii]